MATRTIITLECDLCGTEESVANHVLRIDRKRPLEVDVCEPDWENASWSQIRKAARPIRKARESATT